MPLLVSRAALACARALGLACAPALARGLALALAFALGLAARLAWAQTSTVGQWAGPYSWPLVASHAALLGDGRVLVWSDQAGVTPRIWNPSTNTLTTAPQINSNIVGSAQAILADGTIAIVGGRFASGAGIQDAHWYDSAVPAWYQMQYMTQPRSDATALLLSDSRMLLLSGWRAVGVAADVHESATTLTPWLPLSSAVLALPPTPWGFQLSTGDILVAGPDRATRRLRPEGYGSWSSVTNLLAGTREGGTAVYVPGATDRVLAIGGRNPATASCEVLDLPTTTSWAYTGTMTRARRLHNATLLADGTVLVTGGTLVDDVLEHAVYAAERWTPATGQWTGLASMTVPRRRGSVALLLPDGRVLCAGGGDGTAGSETHADAEIYSPPYLFLGTRPTITTAPALVGYGNPFNVDSPQAGTITAVWLVRCGTVARGFNGDQRALQLTFTATSSRLTVTAPASAAVAPPGTYLLFLVANTGALSVGKIVRVNEAVPPPVAPDITSVPPPSTPPNVPFTYVPTATGTTPMTWSLVTAPSWLAVSRSTGAIAGVPPATGSYAISLRATNTGGSDTQSWTLQVGTVAAGTRIVLPLGATWRYFKGTTNPPSNWAAPGFDASSWLAGPSGFGFGDGDDATVLSDMENNYSTVFTRTTVSLYNVHTATKLSLLYQYDDGFAVYLNGTRIYSRNAPTTITNTSLATASHEASSSWIRQDFTDAATLALLVNGTNTLAAVGLNQTLSSSDVTLKVTVELTGGTDTPVAAEPPKMTGASWHGAGPNPFTRSVHFAFGVAQPGDASLDVFDAAGRRVRHVAVAALPAGERTLQWDGRDAAGLPVPAGIYFFHLQAPGLDRRGKLVRAR